MGPASDRMMSMTGRPAMRSPGRPPARRDVERVFWRNIAKGMTSEDAATACGVSGPVGTRWFRDSGGMPLIELQPPSGRYLSFVEREDIALLTRRATECVRSPAASVGRHRRSRGSCAAMPQLVAANWSIERRLPSGRPS